MMEKVGKSFKEYTCDVFQCSICGYRQLKDGTKCDNPECGQKEKLVWLKTET